MTQQDMDSHDTELLLQETLHPDLTETLPEDTYPPATAAIYNDPHQLDEVHAAHSLESFSEQIISFFNITDPPAPAAPSSHPSDDSNGENSQEDDDYPAVLSSDFSQSMTFSCPKCGRKFTGSWESCSQHIRTRKHGTRCSYNTHQLPPCLSSHALLPIDPHSGWCDLQGRRKYIEDAHAVVLTNDYKFFGVFDGHFGNRAANYASRHIQLLFDELYQARGKQWRDLSEIIPDFASSGRHSFHLDDASQEWKDLYLPTPQEMTAVVHSLDEEEYEQEGDRRTVSDVINYLHHSFTQTNEDFLQTNADSLSGTTATVSILFSDYLLVGNIGDSRAVLCCDSNGKAIQLTVDHTPYVTQERERIISSGGTVEKTVSENDILRVNQVLAVTRSIGDPKFRDVLSSEPDLLVFRRSSPVISPSTSQYPSVTLDPLLISALNPCLALSKHYQLSPTDTEIPQLFLILGSDGLWDVMKNQEVVDFICETFLDSMESQYRETGEYQLPVDSFHRVARDISREAFVRGSMDNIGACVIDLTA
jgi:serine/threonine protein phosphatase PrpC